MARTNGKTTEQPAQEFSVVTEVEDLPEDATSSSDAIDVGLEAQTLDDSLNALKTLLVSVEKLQKTRQDVGDIKPLLVRMLDGEVIIGEELEQLKTGVNGLFRLVKAHTDHQSALVKAQAARDLLDQVLK